MSISSHFLWPGRGIILVFWTLPPLRRLGPWQQRLRRHSTLLINGVYAASWIYTWTERITNNEVRSRTQQPLLSDAVRSRRLRFFGHICRADPSQDHSRALYASTTGLPKHWRRRHGRPRQTWLRTIENDLRPLNLDLATAQRHAQNRTAWQTLVETATSPTSSRWWWWWWSPLENFKMNPSPGTIIIRGGKIYANIALYLENGTR